MAGRNRLTSESSPYLRQHADNPVDWFPWGDDAFAEARRRDVPILLSVGYSACHWCHVMAHESFEDDATADLMNDLYVNVKVDREERPDVDAVYMEAVQSLTGHGGWPMTVFLDHEGRPFYGGTYYPPEPRHGMPAFSQVLQGVAEAWTNQRAELGEQAERLTDAIRRSTELSAGDGDLPGPEVLPEAAARLRTQHDATHGGFGRAPKFPQTMAIELLLRVHARTGDPSVLDVAVHSLDHMAAGGIYDHLGGGFARYSTDERWLVPHFEKMLYDQALLARSYLHAWQVTGDERHLQVLSETVEYVLRDLRAPGGGLCSAEDADSEGVEGRFYVWSLDEVEEVTGDDFEATRTWWEISGAGSWEGTNILHRPVVGDLARPPEVERARHALFERRLGRVRPGLDDKVLTEWNALFLSTLAEAAFAQAGWSVAAEQIGDFLLANLRRDDGRWLRSWQAETGGRHLAYAADHAALLDAFTRLYEATGHRRWLDEAQAVAAALIDLFWDDEHGGLFTTGHDAEALVARQKDLLDGATPSASSTAAVALARLAALTGDDAHRQRAEAIVRLLGPLAASHPMAFANLLAAVDLLVGGTVEVVVAGDRPDLVAEVRRRYLPTAVLAWGERFDAPLWEGRADGRAYVCEGFTCKQPVETVDELAAQLDALSVT
jgi:uncharacterized protein YyaL (SSP411 family)